MTCEIDQPAWSCRFREDQIGEDHELEIEDQWTTESTVMDSSNCNHSFIHSKIYKAPLQEIYSEATPAQPWWYKSVLSNLKNTVSSYYSQANSYPHNTSTHFNFQNNCLPSRSSSSTNPISTHILDTHKTFVRILSCLQPSSRLRLSKTDADHRLASCLPQYLIEW